MCRRHQLSVDNTEDGEDYQEEQELSADEFVQGSLKAKRNAHIIEELEYKYCFSFSSKPFKILGLIVKAPKFKNRSCQGESNIFSCHFCIMYNIPS